MRFDHRFDALTIEELQAAAAGVKWTKYPGGLGAFVAEMDFGTDPLITAALAEAVDNSIFGYLPPPWVERMKQATASWSQQRYGWEIDPAFVHQMPDVISVMSTAIEYFSAPGSSVVVPTPAYMPFLSVPPQLGRQVIEVPMISNGDEYQFDLEGIAGAFANGGGILILCNPSNPLGVTFSREELLAVCEVVEEAGARVFADEIHAPMIFRGAPHTPYASISHEAAAHSITGTSASKGWNLPGLKCAQAIVTNQADQNTWENLPYKAIRGTANLGVIAHAVAYESGAPWLDEVLEYLDDACQFFGEELAREAPGAKMRVPDATYIGWVDLRECGLGERPGAELAERVGLHVNEGTDCGAGYEGFVRITLATPRPILAEIARRIGMASRGERL